MCNKIYYVPEEIRKKCRARDGHKRATVSVTVSSIPTQENEIFIIFISYFALVTRQNAVQNRVPPLNSQCLIIWAESGEMFKWRTEVSLH